MKEKILLTFISTSHRKSLAMQKVEMNMEQLMARPLSYSSLKQFSKSPKHFIEYRTKPFAPSEAMILGSAFEDLVFNEENFDKKYQVFVKAKGDGSVAINRDAYDKATQAGITLLTEEMMKKLEAMKESLLSTDYVRPYIDNVKAKQVRLRWNDKKTGLPFLGYVDLQCEVYDEMFALDLKTTNNGDPEMFPKQAYNLQYNLQWATYAEGYHKMKFKFPYFAYLAVENVDPFNVSLFFIESKTMEESRDEWRATVDAFKYCMDKEQFHMGYEFLLQTRPYFPMRKPGYHKPRFGSHD